MAYNQISAKYFTFLCLVGPSTAGGMAAAKGWRSMITPAILVGTAGYATATFAALALGQLVLMGMVV
jgi:uncharacterized membrane protein